MDERKEILKDLKFLLWLYITLFAIYIGLMVGFGITIINELEKLNEQIQTTHITRRS